MPSCVFVRSRLLPRRRRGRPLARVNCRSEREVNSARSIRASGSNCIKRISISRFQTPGRFAYNYQIQPAPRSSSTAAPRIEAPNGITLRWSRRSKSRLIAKSAQTRRGDLRDSTAGRGWRSRMPRKTRPPAHAFPLLCSSCCSSRRRRRSRFKLVAQSARKVVSGGPTHRHDDSAAALIVEARMNRTVSYSRNCCFACCDSSLSGRTLDDHLVGATRPPKTSSVRRGHRSPSRSD